MSSEKQQTSPTCPALAVFALPCCFSPKISIFFFFSYFLSSYFFVSFLLGSFFPVFFAQHFSLFFAILVFIFCPSVLLSANNFFLFFFVIIVFSFALPPRIDRFSVRVLEKDVLLLFHMLVAYCNWINFEMKINQREKTKN